MVAVVDWDKDRKGRRLAALREGREQERYRTVDVPVALGQADPHVEAWLLDDPVAVRRALQLPADHQMPNVVKSSYPKDDIDVLRRAGGDSDDTILVALSRIADAVVPQRCEHQKETGLKRFVDDVRHELGPLTRK